MNRGILALALLVVLQGIAAATETDLPKPISTDAERLQTGAETEQKEGASAAEVSASTDVVTPISPFVEKDLHQQALDQLIKANNLLAAKQYEAASDSALQAYDGLKDLRLPRKKHHHDRAKLLAERHQAATTYLQAGVAYVQDFAQRTSGNANGIDEARARLEDLRDVAREYPELARKLDQAIAQLASPRNP